MSEAKFKFGDRVWHEVNGEGVVTFVDLTGVLVAWQERGQDDSFFAQPAKFLTHHTTPPPPNTVPVRIAVAVDSSKKWSSAGWHGADIDDIQDFAVDGLETTDNYRVSWVTAHVPLPEQPAEVEGVVE